MSTSSANDHYELLKSVRTRLVDAIRDEDCPIREHSALARRIGEVGKEIVDYEPGVEGLTNYLNLLLMLQTIIKDDVKNPACPYRELSPLTRRLQDIVKEVAALNEQLRAQGMKDGSTNITADEGFDPRQI